MSAYYPLQYDFSGGEISPRLQARVDTELYRKAVAEMTNFYTLPQGSAFFRPGSEYFFETLNNGPARLVQFGRGRERDFIAEFTDGNVRMYNRDGIVQSLGGELLFNRSFAGGSDGLLGWTVDSNLQQLIGPENIPTDVMSFEAVSPFFEVEQLEFAETNNFVDISQSVAATEITPGVYQDQTISTDVTFSGNSNLFNINLVVGDGTTENAYLDLNYTGSGTFATTFTPLGPTITVKWKFSLTANPTGFPNAATISNLSLRPTVDSPLILSSPYTGEELFELDVAMDLGGDVTAPDRLWVVHPNHEPRLLVRISENDWTFDVIVFTAPPADWAPNNYPGTVELFSGRSWFSAVPDSRAQLWASKAGNYFDFTTGSNPGDSLDLELVTRGAIQWVKGQKALLLGTDIAEHTVTSSQSLAIPQVGDVDVRAQSSNGSVPIEPMIIGNEVVYINPDRTKIFATDYLRENDGWISNDLTWVAEHITRAGVTRHTWARDPDNQLFCLLEDGTSALCVYDKRMQTLAWSKYATDGEYISLATTNDLSGSSKWYCVKRLLGDGTVKYYVETVQAGEINNQYMDSWLNIPTVNNVVSGLDHLEGLTVKVLVAGAVEPDQVVTGGQITTVSNGEATVGLGYVGSITTLRTEGGNPAGSSQAGVMGYSDVVLRINNSAVPKVEGELPPLREAQTPMNTPTPLLTGDTETYHLNADKGQITITQDLPLRTEITAVYGKVRSSIL